MPWNELALRVQSADFGRWSELQDGFSRVARTCISEKWDAARGNVGVSKL